MKQWTILIESVQIKFKLIIGIPEELREYGDKFINMENSTNADNFVMQNDKGELLMAISRKSSTGMIVHESTHMLWQIAEQRGLSLTYESQEWQAYMLQFIVSKVLEKYKQYEDWRNRVLRGE